MKYTVNDVMTFIEENDVKFIKLAFCDVRGKLKIISIQPPMLDKAFSTGIPIKPKLIEGFGHGVEDVYIKPDIDTMCTLPWRPSHGSVIRFFCDIVKKDGTPFACDTRNVLREVSKKVIANDMRVKISNGIEFYLFKNDEEGNPTEIPFDRAGYMDEAPDDKGEDIRRDICLTLEDMGITPTASHHNAGPGQNEVDFIESSPMSAADNVVAYRSVVKNMADRSGLHASFRPKPLQDECGNSFRIKFAPRYKGSHCDEPFLAGLIRRCAEITAVLNSRDESYDRLGDSEIPDTVTWKNKSGRNIFNIDHEEGTVEIISPDSSANPYLAYALLLAAGMEGVLDYITLRDVHEVSLPGSLGEAKLICRDSDFVKSVLPPELLNTVAGR